ncbi:MAG: hypothetical protein QME48_00640 [bacterium]|nr:hypothetical protein [bacterium]
MFDFFDQIFVKDNQKVTKGGNVATKKAGCSKKTTKKSATKKTTKKK